MKSVGWNGELVNESYPWVEKQIVHWPELAPWQQAFRDGLLQSGVSPFNGYTFDHIYGTKVGGTIFDVLCWRRFHLLSVMMVATSLYIRGCFRAGNAFEALKDVLRSLYRIRDVIIRFVASRSAIAAITE